jgi:hypothetical protein
LAMSSLSINARTSNMGSVSTLFQLMIQFLTLFHALLKREILTFDLFSELLFVCSFVKSCMCMRYIISALYSYSFCNLLLHLLLFTHFLEAYCPVRKGDLFLATGGMRSVDILLNIACPGLVYLSSTHSIKC